eukprot:7363114-Pyramimonas_sp.AAC.1
MQIESHLRTVVPDGYQLYGFVLGKNCQWLSALLKNLARHPVLWGKPESCYILSCDVGQAFDHLTVRSAVESLWKLGFEADI